MTLGVILSDEQMKIAREYIEDLEAYTEDPTISEDDRLVYLRQWQGARRVLRKMGLKDIYSYS